MDAADGIHSLDDHLCSLVDSFLSMNKDDQKEYLALYNKCLDPNSLSDTLLKEFQQWKKFAQLHEEKWISNDRFHVDRHFILKIICIFHTNAYQGEEKGGLAIKGSRFNHSCSSNSENVLAGNDICTSEMQIRATFKIKKGEEVCVNYFSFTTAMKNKKERQDELQGEWGFICSCDRCQDEITNDDGTYEKFQKLQEEAEKYVKIGQNLLNGQPYFYVEKCLDFFEKVISYRKEMFDLAEKKKAPKQFIYNKVLAQWFDLEVKRYWFVKDLVFDMGKKELVGKMEYFKGECQKLAKITFQMIKTLHENDSIWAREWKEKSENFENWFQNGP